MTVQVSDRLSQLYVGNGGNTRFDFMFRAYEQEDETGIGVRVKVGNDFEFIDESEYAVTFNPDNMGGYVTFVEPPNSENFFYIAGKTPVDQLLDITNYDNFYPDAIERALDKLTAILQEWKHLVDFETQARILADIDYDQLAIQREADLKAYIDGIASSIIGQPVVGLPAQFVTYGDRNQKQVNDELLGDNGAGVINLSFSEIANSVRKSLYEIVYDQVLDVTKFGAIGNWDMENQIGFDSTQAVANAIGFYSTLGTRRQGGRRAIKFPYGNFKLSSISIPASIEFGIDFIGDGLHSTFLWFDHQNTSPAIDCQVEFTQFRDLSLMGSLSDQNGGDSSKWKQVGFKGKLATNYPDVDVKFNNCGLFFFQDLTQIYGRGCIIENCITGFITNVMNIVCSPDTVFVANADTNSNKTGMRHYTIRNTRFDVCSNIYKITGTSSSIDYINGILFVGNDLLYCDKIIDAPDATIRRALIANNTALMSFASGLVRCKASKSCSMSFNNWSKGYDDTVAPVSAAKGIEYLWLSSGKSENLTIAGNHVKNLTSTPVNVGPSSASVKVLNNDFDEAWTFSSSPNHYVVYSSADIAGLTVEGNTFNSSNVSGTYRLANHSVQNHKNTRFGINQAPWVWQDSRCSFVPKLKVNGIDSATAATATHGRYYIDQNYVYVEVILVINPAETTGDLGFSLPPISAVAENSTISTQYSGAGTLHKVTGLTLAGYNLSSIVVNPSNQIAELWRQKDLVQSRLTAADKSGTISLYATFKYRY